jgi:mono/diheme cytochrome c family protein
MSKQGREAERVAGVLAEYETPGALMDAAEKVRDQGYQRWDCFTPFPVHGLDDAMGIKMTLLPGIVLTGGIIGFFIAIFFQCWSNGVDYPWVISGKPLFSYPAYFPVTFEFTVLLSAFTCFFGVLLFNQLPLYYYPTFRVDRFRRATNDRFFVYIESRDKQFDVGKAQALLDGTNPSWSGVVREPARPDPYPKWLIPMVMFIGLGLSMIPLYVAANRGAKFEQTRIHIVQDMDDQPKFGPQKPSLLFEDGRSTRPFSEGTVAVGEAKVDTHFHEGKIDGKNALGLPPSVKPTRELLARGQRQFNIHCAVCHGLVGDGQGIVHKRALELREPTWVQPRSMYEAPVVNETDGHLFNVISHGIRSMPAYGYKVPAADRWAIVLYVRALQLSRNAPLDAVPAGARGNLQQK